LETDSDEAISSESKRELDEDTVAAGEAEIKFGQDHNTLEILVSIPALLFSVD
jgi:hypothetical protein